MLRHGRASIKPRAITTPTLGKEAALAHIAQDASDTHAANLAALQVVADTHGPAMTSLLASAVEADKYMMFIGPTVVKHFGGVDQGHKAIEGLTTAFFGLMEAGFRLFGLAADDVELLRDTFQNRVERQRWSINKARGKVPATS